MKRIQVGSYRFYKKGKKRYPSVTTIISVLNKPGIMFWKQKLILNSFQEQINTKIQSNEYLSPQILEEIATKSKKAPSIESDRSANFGSLAHDYIDKLCIGEEIDESSIPNTMKPIIEGFEKWKIENNDISLIKTEELVYSDKYEFAGTIDAIGKRIPNIHIVNNNINDKENKNEKENEKKKEKKKEKENDNHNIIVIDWKTSNSIYDEYAVQLSAYAKAYEEMTGKPVHEGWIVRFNKEKPGYVARRIKNIDECFNIFLSCLNIFKNLYSSSGSLLFTAKDSKIK
eukprot:TRINITY_DN432_c0_g1_i1.p1 TRINITY_DN432_c0_g1~~TRINITY_DN432_c0_g1_i1.p1  ORF type:complete len:286 (+),score=82.15 TRINITY_DN432_c0_g1_i1:68-925(+)